MLRKINFSVLLYFSSLSLSACLTTVTYKDYIYEPTYHSSSELSLDVEATGYPRALPGKKLQEVRESPYKIRLVFSDKSLDYLSARVVSAELKGLDSGQVKMIDYKTDADEFRIKRENEKSQIATVLFLKYDIPMNKEDYAMKLKMEFCKPSGCFEEVFDVTLKLKLNTYKRNANWATMQSI